MTVYSECTHVFTVLPKYDRKREYCNELYADPGGM